MLSGARQWHPALWRDDPRAVSQALTREGIGFGDLVARLSSGPPERPRTEQVDLVDVAGRRTALHVHVPAAIGNRPHRVLLALHGAGGSGAEMAEAVAPLAELWGAVLLCPDAQRPASELANFDLSGPFGRAFTAPRWTSAPDDFPRLALRWARENLTVDHDRCAVLGTSMGGVTTWDLAARHWDALSLAVPINGALSVWQRFGPDETAAAVEPSLLNLALVVVHGVDDEQIPADLDGATVARLRLLGHTALQYLPVPGSHALTSLDLSPESECFRRVLQVARSAVRRPWPQHVAYRMRGKDARLHWLEVRGITPGRTATVVADVRGSIISVQCSEAAEVAVHLSEALISPGPVTVVVNGRAHELLFVPSLEVAIASYDTAEGDAGRLSQMTLTLEVPALEGALSC